MNFRGSPSFTEQLRSSARSWRVIRRGFAAGAAILIGLLAWFNDRVDGGLWADLAGAAILALATYGALTLALRAARRTSMQRAEDLTARLDEALANGREPVLTHTGWSAFDALSAAIQRTLSDRNAQLAHQRMEADHYRMLAEGSVGLEAYFSPRGRLLWVSPAVEPITGHTQEECYASHDIIDLWVYQKDRALIRELAARARSGESREDHELRLAHRDGRTTWFTCRWYPQRDAAGNVIGMRFSAQSIQSRKDAELKLLETVAALRRAQALKEHYLSRSNDERMRLASLLDTVQLGILFVDRDRRVVYINQPAVELWQLPDRDALVGARDEVLIDHTRPLRLDDVSYRRHIEEVLSLRGRSEPFDVHLTDGRVIREVSALVPSSDGSRAIGRVWVFEDVTEAHHAARRLTELAERDPLTGLYNRRRFLEELDRHLADAERRQEEVGLISFDLDGFKAINDSFGHQAGDEVLIELSNQVGAIVRRNELFFRLGGDEFAILVANTDADSMAQLSRRVLARAASLAFSFDGIQAGITLSLGFAIAPRHARDPMGLVAAADRAMYAAKAQGKNRWESATGQDEAERQTIDPS